MATFQKITDVNVTETLSDSAKVFVEDGGELKRVAKSQVGGAGGGSLSTMSDVIVVTVDAEGNYTSNKTFNEVTSLIMSGELCSVVLRGSMGSRFISAVFPYVDVYDACICFENDMVVLYMTPDNHISETEPSGDPS